MESKFVCDRLEDLDAVAADLVEKIGAPGVVLFYGEMGAGKTTLIGSVCKALQSQDEVSSPTFGLVNEYQDKNGTPIYHFDFYRVENAEEAMDIGVEEYFDSGTWCLVEWPEKIDILLPSEAIRVHVNTDGEKRIFRLIE
ncbi:MAG: tRNA (adenosine(37)-N6)-threonylcarbamoyltransferase complex ATPase subunit type 1 TsaE [Flavobacteriales bacterium]|nr:tRNA (adenosine(37)-N6)-threonylcarbamoyltransferase complex ATPase subunit type 1 TsaE [Flavobacteriales bacterium]